MSLNDELKTLLNRHSAENESNTPDFVLAEYLLACLFAFDSATKKRDRWWVRGATFRDLLDESEMLSKDPEP